ncbi:MAG TPA: ParB/RepB/Spo0J family partition protein [Candidatus Saccharimonadia bacterium]|nr:ParB/RepB/Spo0J family partition protein [Candidatus Saccharimonadia bacterium]
MIRPKGLGRGLDALLAGTDEAAPSRDALQTIALDRLRPGRYQPRTRMDDASLGELAESIRSQGVMQPILVRPVDGGRFEIIAGERRWRAAQRAGLREIPVLVKAVPDQAALALIENIQREDLNPLEEAQGLKRLIDEFGLTHDAAAQAVGRSRSAVTNLLRLTQLAKPVQEYLMGNALEMGHARALLALSAAQQTSTAARVVERRLSVRETERLVQQLAAPVKRARLAPAAGDTDTRRLETELAERLGAAVRIEPGRKGSGRVVIRYGSLEELDGILAKLR